MSAITAVLSLNQASHELAHGYTIMEELKRYRADYRHTWQGDDIFLGCHGQWITPESLSEVLPAYDRERGLAITADAIIDNREELFGKLAVPAMDRQGMSDSKLIMLAYEKWGEKSPEHLIGDFAFMIWDSRAASLFGARDFSGNRTLYVTRTSSYYAFCTAIKPLLALPEVDRRLNEQWISEFLAIPISTEAVDVHATVYERIGQIPPAHSFTIREGELRFNRYCTIVSDERLRLGSNEEYEEAFRDVFSTAIASKLRTYKEVGAKLSGGLDSGSVVSFAAKELRNQEKRLHTFSYVPLDEFQDWTPRSRVANEREYIQATVQHVGNIHDQYFSFAEKNPLSEVDDMLEMIETPYKFYENSYWVKGIYEQAAASNVGTLLSGSRGNWTISWGPALDYQARLLRQFRWMRLAHEIRQYSANMNANRARLYHSIGKKAFPLVDKWLSRKQDQAMPKLINPEFARRTNVYERLQQHGYDFWGQSGQNVYDVRRKQFEKLYYWTTTGSVGCKQSLRHSLWDRDATNDLRVIRFCLSVPQDQFVQNGYGRSLIRRSTLDYLPDHVRLNQKFRGIQGADGLHRILPIWREVMEKLEQAVQDDRMSPYVNTSELTRSLEAIRHDPRPDHIFGTEFRLLMRSYIFHRFLANHA
ncbi:asparagine synthase-related protein [Paenibacillus chungangensis]|uniref:asparagine synthase (glutamine-hydrolyzing) n=1 Tax=Paenibacillus chungangensis TaxID=696535 RepID=A0ABW3HVV9_9BACL